MSGDWNSAAAVQAAYRAACWLDLAALKPGNVSESSPGHGMAAQDFHLSASVTAEVLTRPGLGLGEAIFSAVAITRRRVGCNTNLGILLLCVPLARAALASAGPHELRETLGRILREAHLGDSARVFEAIRLAKPGGLGTSNRHDVRQVPRVGLCRAMAAAADRDLIARQYVTDFADVFDVALPRFRKLKARRGHEGCAVTVLFLYLLARAPDSHVARKHGPEKAAELTQLAQRARRVLAAGSGALARRHLETLDARLKAEDVNPGTTADLTVATLFLERLLGQPQRDTAARGSALTAATERTPVREAAFPCSRNDLRSLQQWQ